MFAAVSLNASSQWTKQTYVTGRFVESVIPSPKVIANFKRSYPVIDNEKWSTENGYFFASFKTGDIKNQVVYTQTGQLDYSMKTYGEHLLPSTVRSAIKSIYYDYDITNAKELDVNNKRIYVVSINDLKTFKTVRVHNGELEEIKSYSTVISPCR